MDENNHNLPPDFAELLKRLDADPERANEQLALLRQKLIVICRNRRLPPEKIDDLVQETLFRLIRRLDQTTDKNLFYYTLRILRNVILEGWRDPDTKENPYDPANPKHQELAESPEEQMEKKEHERHLLACTNACLRQLPQDDLELYTKYKTLNSHDKATRDAIATLLGKNRSAINAQISRIGARLRTCIEKCMKQFELPVQQRGAVVT